MKYCFVADDCKDAIHTLGLRGPQDWMRYAVQDIVVDRTVETRRLQPPSPLPGCYAKIYRYPRWDDRLRIFFRGGVLGRSRARVEFDNLRHLNARGLSPRVIACGQERKGGIQRTSLLVIEEVSDTVSLDNFIPGPFSSFAPAKRREFIDALARFTRTMNAGGFVNSEYHWRNILVRPENDGFFFQIIDPSSSRWRYRLFYPYFDVASLDVCGPYFLTRTERLRFFKRCADCPKGRLSARDKKRIAQIIRLRDQIAQKELKRYRRILPAEVLAKQKQNKK